MCGISGIYNLDGQPVQQDLLERMNRTLVHRGPDDEGYYIDDNIGLGHRRLSIIDLNTGHQPIFNEDGSKSIVFNGEIYNFIELKNQLEKKGHVFRTKTDTEVILHGYEQWGTGCLDRLRGMFAFAIWDKEERTLFLARDRLGKKPIYYTAGTSTLLFASEIKAILEHDSLKRELDLEALSDYLTLGYVPAPKTIFRGIAKLPPGHMLICEQGNMSIRQYWDVRFLPEHDVPVQEFCDRLLATLEEAVRIRLVSDVPLGAFLSGGIDSSLVVALMASLQEDPVITNSIGFTERKYSELEYAQMTSKAFNTEHHEYVVSPDALDVVNKLSWYFDEPFADSSAIPTYYVSKIARQHVTVALSGDGGDENFAGYRRYYFDRLENRLRSLLPAGFRQRIVGALARTYPKGDWLPQVLRAKTMLTNLAQDSVWGYFNSMSYSLPDMKPKVMCHDFTDSLQGYDSIEIFRNYFDLAATDDPLSRIQYVDFKTYLVDDILTKVDRASMANSLEVRVPILDHELVELAARIPSHLKLNGYTSKFIFKKAASRILPRETLNRKKMGFSIPMRKWLQVELRELVQDTILSKTFAERSLFDLTIVHKLWQQHASGLRDFSQPLWALLSFELWARRFMDEA